MADEQIVSEVSAGTQDQGTPEKKKSKLNLFSKLGAFKIPALFVLVIILAMATALVVTKVTQGDAAAKTKNEAKAGKEHKLGKFISMEPFTVNLAGGSNYLQAVVVLEIDSVNVKLEEELKERKPQISDIIISELSSKMVEDIDTNAGREKLKADIKKAVDSLLGYGKIERVYFTTFIMQ